ncbi:conserved hypothetical protein [Coccidioides posadasii str. Silveira]|uniref:Uncharacterized protein n=2 Tax=Coccidioides posadasii TaxID=199306 RepID=E9D7C3_COCPS|nr:conserved hypothetical protein [Coccidioides posadasii str. Silveira]KMM71077.1 hypothetical protein CPAG_07384 [Coccidioides posadasii RMSCC 3488]
MDTGSPWEIYGTTELEAIFRKPAEALLMALTDGRMEMILRCPRRRTISVSADGQESRVVSVKMLWVLADGAHPPGGAIDLLDIPCQYGSRVRRLGRSRLNLGPGKLRSSKTLRHREEKCATKRRHDPWAQPRKTIARGGGTTRRNAGFTTRESHGCVWLGKGRKGMINIERRTG